MASSAPGRPTLQSVADAAGVSVMTVSRALRNHPEVSPATAARLQKIARSLGYQPNPLISVLMENVRRGGGDGAATNLAFLHAGPTRAHWKTLAHYRELFDGVKARASELGFGLEKLWVDDPGVTPAGLVRLLHARGVRGLIIGPVFRPQVEFELSAFSVVALGLSLKSPLVHRVATNQQASVQIALGRLRDAGHRRIGFVLRRGTDDRYDHQWFGAAWAEYHLVPKEERVPPLVLDGAREAPELIAAWLRRHRADSLLVSDDRTVAHVRALGLTKPPVIVNLMWEAGRSSVAGVARDRVRIGAAAVNMVAAMLARNERGVPASAELLLVSPRWMEAPVSAPAVS